jgi:hypothetical protein
MSRHWLTRPTSAPFRVRAAHPYPASYPSAHQLEDQPDLTVSCCLSATGVRFLGHPVPAEDLSLPHGQPTERHQPPGPQRGFHVPHERDTTGVGAPLTPRRRCLSGRQDRYRPAPASSQRPALHPTTTTHRRGLGSRGIIRGSLTFTRPVFPGPVAPGWNESPWAHDT